MSDCLHKVYFRKCTGTHKSANIILAIFVSFFHQALMLFCATYYMLHKYLKESHKRSEFPFSKEKVLEKKNRFGECLALLPWFVAHQ